MSAWLPAANEFIAFFSVTEGDDPASVFVRRFDEGPEREDDDDERDDGDEDGEHAARNEFLSQGLNHRPATSGPIEKN